MKQYSIFIVFCSCLLLGGCTTSPQQESAQLDTTGSVVVSSIPTQDVSQESSGGTIKQGIIFSGKQDLLLLSGDVLIYSNKFSLNLPKDLSDWEYEPPKRSEQYRILFSEKTGEKRFTINSKILPLLDQKQTIEKKCKITNIKENGVLSKKTIVKKIGGETILVTNRTYQLAGPDITTPEKWDESDICFQIQNKVYNIYIGGYKKEISNLIQSLKIISNNNVGYQEGKLSSGTLSTIPESNISWSSNKVNYKNVFSIETPLNVDNWKYQIQIVGDEVLFSSKDNGAVQIFTQKPPKEYREFDTENKCGFVYPYYEKKERKLNNNNEIYVMKNIKYLLPNETTIPLNQTSICFVHNGLLYGIDIANIASKDIETIVNSLTFTR